MKKLLSWLCIILLMFFIIKVSFPIVAGIIGATDQEQDEVMR